MVADFCQTKKKKGGLKVRKKKNRKKLNILEQIFSYKKSQTESNFLFNIRQTYMLQNFTLNLFTLYIFK